MADSSRAGGRKLLGVWALIFGLVSVFGMLMIGQASGSELIPGFDPPGWFRVVTGWMIPVGVLAASGFGILAAVRRSGRWLGILGMVLAVATVLISVNYLVTHPY